MKSFYLLIILFILPIQIFAQTSTFHIGLKLEFYSYTLQKGHPPKIYISPLPSFHVLVSKDLSESVSFNVKPGILFRPIECFELNFSLHYKFPASGIFLIGGFDLDFIGGDASNIESIESKIISSAILGIGYQLNKRLYTDISFHQPINGKLGRYDSSPEKLFNMLKIGLAAVL